MNHGRWGGWRVLGTVLAVVAGLCADTSTASAVSVHAACPGPVPPGSARCFALRRTDITSLKADTAAPAPPPTGYAPADLQDAYGLAAAAATGGGRQTIGIVDAYHDPTAESDLGVYRSQYGLPECTTANGCFQQVDLSGGKIDSGWAGETSLDLDMVSAICPSCRIVLVEAASSGFGNLGTAINTAVSKGADVLSNSWGGSEFSSETQSPWTGYLNHPGIPITASTGDSGFGPQWPAASPVVTAVGGTSLHHISPAWTESAWSGAGAGCSVYEPKLSWQHDTGCTHRSIGDVSAVADPATGVAVYQTTGDSGWTEYGGTSVAAPIIAAVYALAGTPGASDYPVQYPYLRPTELTDVTTGSDANNCSPTYLCFAGVGYDGPTGLGTPKGIAAFTAAGLATTTTLSASPNPANAGDAVTLTATVNSGTAPTGTVTFRDGDNPLGTGSVSPTGQAVLSTAALGAGHHSLVATYGGDATHGPSSSATQDELVNAPAPPQTNATPTKTSPATGATSASASASPLLTCSATPIALIDVLPEGRFVRISGVATPDDAGKTVQILLAKKVVAVTAVRSDGTFRALANLPSARTRSTARYSATVAGATSTALKLQRRSYLTRASVSGGRLTLAGKVTGAFRPGAKVTVEEITRCTVRLRIATARLSRTGTWKVVVGISGDVSRVVFRARTTVLSGHRSSTTVSLPHPATG